MAVGDRSGGVALDRVVDASFDPRIDIACREEVAPLVVRLDVDVRDDRPDALAQPVEEAGEGAEDVAVSCRDKEKRPFCCLIDEIDRPEVDELWVDDDVAGLICLDGPSFRRHAHHPAVAFAADVLPPKLADLPTRAPLKAQSQGTQRFALAVFGFSRGPEL